MATVTVPTPKCMVCGKNSLVTVDKDEHAAWLAGALIQNAMPNTSIDVREQLITGTHPECWDKLMRDDGIDAE